MYMDRHGALRAAFVTHVDLNCTGQFFSICAIYATNDPEGGTVLLELSLNRLSKTYRLTVARIYGDNASKWLNVLLVKGVYLS